MSKKGFLSIFIVVLLLLLGCTKNHEMHSCDYKNDNIDDYPNNLKTYLEYRRSEFIEEEKDSYGFYQPMIPRIIPEINEHIVVEECFFYCDSYKLLLDDLCQCYIMFSIDSKEVWDSEIGRLSSITYFDDRAIKFEATLFVYPAFIVTLEHFYGASEYLLLDEENLLMYYVHYDGFDRDNLSIPYRLLPIDGNKVEDFSVFYER